jgi:hypothetical protein
MEILNREINAWITAIHPARESVGLSALVGAGVQATCTPPRAAAWREVTAQDVVLE